MKIAVIAVGTRGDVEPHAALCAGLRAAGYDARLCAPLDEAPAIAQWNLPYAPLPLSIRDFCGTGNGRALLTSGRNGLRLLRDLRAAGHEIAAQVVAGIRTACEDADAVCYSPLGLPALYVARERGIPAIATGLQPLGVTGEHASPLLPLPDWSPGFVNKLSHRLVEAVYSRAIWPLIRTHLRVQSRYERASLMLFGYSAHVVPRPGDWKPWMHATGYWTAPDAAWEPPADLVRFLAAGPAICLGFGSMQGPRVERILAAAFEMVRRTGRRAVVLTGWNGTPPDAARAGGNVFVTPAVPHGWLFPRVTAVVHHGGAGTTAAALRAGCPSIIAPFFFDQAFWAHRLAARGLGPRPLGLARISWQALARALDAVERSPETAERLRHLSFLLRAEDGVGKAVTILSEALERKPDADLQPQL